MTYLMGSKNVAVGEQETEALTHPHKNKWSDLGGDLRSNQKEKPFFVKVEGGNGVWLLGTKTQGVRVRYMLLFFGLSCKTVLVFLT